MATGPGDELEAAGRGHLRASHADREQVIGTLKAAFVQGMLTKDEFHLRVAQALASRTYAELAALTADFPAGVAAAQPLQPARAREVARVRRPGAVLYVIVWPVGAFVVPKSSEGEALGGFGLVALATLFYLVVLATRGMDLLFSWQDKRSARQLPRRPGPGASGQTPPRIPPSDPGGQFPTAGHGHWHTAEAAPSRRPRPSLPGSRSPRRWRHRGLLARQRPAVTHTA